MPTVWDYTENPPPYAENVRDLWSWSLNYGPTDKGNPWPVFLDLVGYSGEHWGEPLTRDGVPTLGLWECDYLADALRAWCNRPGDVEEWIDGLMAADD